MTSCAAASCSSWGRPPAAPSEPPPEVATLLAKLRRGEGPTPTTDALAARDDAAPYLRLELAAPADPQHRRNLTEALEAIEDRIGRRNLERAARWAADGRLDLLAELLSSCPDGDAAAVARHVNAASVRLARALDEFNPPPLPGFVARDQGFLPYFEGLARPQSGDEVVTRPQLGNSGFVRARRATIGNRQRDDWLVAVSEELRDADALGGVGTNWWRSVVLVNGPTRCHELEWSLLVCDGDAELTGPRLTRSLVLANGTITLRDDGSLHLSALWAAGDIVVRRHDGRRPTPNSLLAGGAVKAPKGADLGAAARGGARCPFGVKFLDPAEFGVQLAAQNGGVQVMAIEPWSPLARCGVENGDVIRSADGDDTTTIAAVRRALRRGVVRESTVLHVRRGDRLLARVVYLDGVPPPHAPPPREAPPKPPAP